MEKLLINFKTFINSRAITNGSFDTEGCHLLFGMSSEILRFAIAFFKYFLSSSLPLSLSPSGNPMVTHIQSSSLSLSICDIKKPSQKLIKNVNKRFVGFLFSTELS